MAAATAARHLGLGRADRIFIPSPMAHQTGFLYGMWLALILGVPQILQPAWDGRTGLRALRRWSGGPERQGRAAARSAGRHAVRAPAVMRKLPASDLRVLRRIADQLRP